VARWIRQRSEVFIYGKRRREELWLGLTLGFAAGVMVSVIVFSVMLEMMERVPPA
jgi:hypothetical protein